MKYDPVKKTVTTEADESIFELSSIDKDMEVKNDKPSNTGAQQVFKKKSKTTTLYRHSNRNEHHLQK